jgi:hypothetical protein
MKHGGHFFRNGKRGEYKGKREQLRREMEKMNNEEHKRKHPNGKEEKSIFT